MTVLIVGGDYVTSFKHLISTQRHARIEHWSGRKKGFNKRSLPNETQLETFAKCMTLSEAPSIQVFPWGMKYFL